ncbi:hypothetical protein PC9H_011805 [Pleurotus ostreatus]|uniref:Uncharacterized protein n=1 Tax=Pleurotus ostreatus TaxID=5322 RepID=A0A8H6ZMG9_PLEOS|nr:uncharacterized protein PC9H_011805 [Pleurotus ostreatus]KAF7421283.1 hypothetical protein PC9H_011805 [Pleurotus ostreatus]
MAETTNNLPTDNTETSQRVEQNGPAPKRPRLERDETPEEGELIENPTTQTRGDIDMERDAGGRHDQDPATPSPPRSPPPLPPAYLENPHMQFSRRDLAPLLPAESRIAFTQGYFVKDCVKGPPDSSAQGHGSAGGARERGRADERSTQDLASALMLRPPSPAVSQFRREQGERRAPRRSPERRLRRTSDGEGTKIQMRLSM